MLQCFQTNFFTYDTSDATVENLGEEGELLDWQLDDEGNIEL